VLVGQRWSASAIDAETLLRANRRPPTYGDTFVQVSPITETAHALLENERLPEEIFINQAQRLHDLGLVEGGSYTASFNGPLTARLTPEGQDLVESGRTVEDYMSDQKRQRATNETHFHGPVSGNVSWSSNHVSQTVQSTSTGLAADEIANLVRAIVEALPALNLSEEAQREVTTSAQVLEGELERAEPDQQLVRTYMQRIRDAIVTEAGSSLGQVLVAHTKMFMALIGAPIE
jgi:hypothetical protein